MRHHHESKGIEEKYVQYVHMITLEKNSGSVASCVN